MGNPFDDYLEQSINSRETTGQDTAQNASRSYATLPFYPNEKYLAKNWKPEVYPISAIEQIARAQALAVKKGVMSPELAKYFLPTQLVENRPTNFGMSDFLEYEGNKNPFEKIAADMQLGPPRELPDSKISILRALQQLGTPVNLPEDTALPKGYRALGYSEMPEEPIQRQLALQDNANLAATFFGMKGKGKSPEAGAKAWNGAGKLQVAGKTLADADNHMRKVREMMAMLNHPANAGIKSTWEKAYADAMAGR